MLKCNLEEALEFNLPHKYLCHILTNHGWSEVSLKILLVVCRNNYSQFPKYPEETFSQSKEHSPLLCRWRWRRSSRQSSLQWILWCNKLKRWRQLPRGWTRLEQSTFQSKICTIINSWRSKSLLSKLKISHLNVM